jgi:hypothetical protein
MSDAFPIHNGLKEGDDCISLFFFIMNHQDDLKLSGLYQVFVHVEDINLLGRNTNAEEQRRNSFCKPAKKLV